MPENNEFLTIPSPLGWISLVVGGDILKQLSIGHKSRRDAESAVLPLFQAEAAAGRCAAALLERLEAYLSGEVVDFRDVAIDPGPVRPFARRVIDACREINYGRTATYGELAARAGSPNAARAVGTCMAGNRICLVIPCHRVVRADGRPGEFSSVGGSALKTRILALEADAAGAKRG